MKTAIDCLEYRKKLQIVLGSPFFRKIVRRSGTTAKMKKWSIELCIAGKEERIITGDTFDGALESAYKATKELVP